LLSWDKVPINVAVYLFQKKQIFSKKKFRKNMGEIIETAIICSVITLFGLSLGFLFIKMQDS
jgi:hypothetical protein